MHETLTSPSQAQSRQPLSLLIPRHLNLVYSAALRQVKDPHLAEDITQAVFLILSKKHHTLRNDAAIGGWLLSVTRRTAGHAMRIRSTTRRHERALAKPEVSASDTPEADWQTLSPEIDAALDALPHRDRDAIVLHILQDHSFPQISQKLGISEDAARMRCARALNRLRNLLTRRGITTSSSALSAAIGAHAISHAPIHLLPATLVAASGTAPSTVAALAKATLKTMAWNTAKLSAAITAAGILFVSILCYASAPLLRDKPLSKTLSAPAKPPSSRVSALFHDPGYAVTAFSDFSGEGVKSIGFNLISDSAGTLYSIGGVDPTPETHHGVIRQKSPGSSSWTTIYELPDATFQNILMDQQGNFFVTGFQNPPNIPFKPHPTPPILLRRAPGQTSFAAVQTGLKDGRFVLPTSDSAGNLYVGRDSIPNKKGVIEYYRLPAGELSFQLLSLPEAPPAAWVSTVSSGRFPGLYALSPSLRPIPADQSPSNVGAQAQTAPADHPHWIIHKSLDAGATWRTLGQAETPPSRGLSNPLLFADSSGTLYLLASYTTEPSHMPAAPSAMQVLHTSTDGGLNWRVASSNPVYGNGKILVGATALADSSGNVFLTDERWENGNYIGCLRLVRGGEFTTLLENLQTTYRGIAFDDLGNIWLNENIGNSNSEMDMGWHILCLTPPTHPSTEPASNKHSEAMGSSVPPSSLYPPPLQYPSKIANPH